MRKAPVLPASPQTWSSRFQDEYSRILRLAFQDLTATGPLRGTTLLISAGVFATTLAAPAGAGDTTLTLTDVTNFPASGYGTLGVSEKFYWDGILGNVLQNVQRGALGTTAQAFSAGDVVVPRSETGLVYVHPDTQALYRIF